MIARMAHGTGRHGLGTALRCAALALLMVSAAAACTDGGRGGDDPTDDRGAALEVVLVEGGDGLDEEARAGVEADVGDAISQYLVGAFLGEFPRDDFVQSFAGFTSLAARGAAEDIDRLTAYRYKDADRVEATRLLVRISCLAEGDDVVGATAEVDFGFDVSGEAASSEFALTGRFLLVEDDGQWSIFGYDVHRDDIGQDLS